MSKPASERRRKEAHPEKFCPVPRCLYRTDGTHCPRHAQNVTLADLQREDAIDEAREVLRECEERGDYDN